MSSSSPIRPQLRGRGFRAGIVPPIREFKFPLPLAQGRDPTPLIHQRAGDRAGPLAKRKHPQLVKTGVLRLGPVVN